MNLLDSVTKENILKAKEIIDRDGVPNKYKGKNYAVEIDGSQYPFKYLIFNAYKNATGENLDLNDFPSSDSLRNKFEKLYKFKIINLNKMDYSDFEKIVYNHLYDKHKKDENFTFSVRQSATKGSESDIFIGTRKASYFSTTFWNIPVSFPGLAGDLFDFIFYEKEGIYYIRFLFFISRNAPGEQNKINIELGNIYYEKVKGLPYEIYKSPDKNKMFDISIYYPKQGYRSIPDMLNALDEMIEVLTPIVDESIAINKKKYPEWKAHRITIDEFKKMIEKMNKRIEKQSFLIPNNGKIIVPRKEEEIEDQIEYSSKNLNIILYGPPGTGKTYNTIDKAVEIITGMKSNNHKDNKIKFDDLRKTGQIEFVTFHQNYSYEDFVVGIKPDTDNEKLLFRQNKGIFYEITKRARDNYLESKGVAVQSKSFDSILENILKPLDKGEKVEIRMKSGISFTIYDTTEHSILFEKRSGGTAHTLSIETLKEILDGVRESPSGLTSYYNQLVEKIKAQKIATKKSEDLKNFVLIIDEINRANISRVFGELITLIEEDKRLGAENEIKISLPNKEKDFSISPNLYIIGTMNTADKSIALVDIALRRRFQFIGYYPTKELLSNLQTEGKLSELAVNLLKSINKNIADKKGVDFVIGHAYFINKFSEDDIKDIIENKIIPLINEYFSCKIEMIVDIFKGSPYSINYNKESYKWEIIKI